MVCIATPTQEYTLRSIVYTLESASIPGKQYHVTVDEQGWSCDCRASDYTKTRGRCWHLKAAQNGEAGKPTVRLGLAPQPFTPPAIPAKVRDIVASLYGAD